MDSTTRVLRLVMAVAGLSLLASSCASSAREESGAALDATPTSSRSSSTDGATSTTESTMTTTAEAPVVTVLHADPNGAGAGDGSIDRPFNRLGVALQSLKAGQTLIVHGGTYTEQINVRSLGVGTADEPIVVRAADRERPLVVGLLWMSGLKTIAGSPYYD